MKKLRVLIVEDSELLCTHLARILAEVEGTEIVGTALSVADARRCLEETAPDLAILDFFLPDGNGLDVIKVIRSKGYPSTIAMYTHYPYPQYKKKCLDAGADHFFDKYTDFEKLLKLVRRMDKANNGATKPS